MNLEFRIRKFLKTSMTIEATADQHYFIVVKPLICHFPCTSSSHVSSVYHQPYPPRGTANPSFSFLQPGGVVSSQDAGHQKVKFLTSFFEPSHQFAVATHFSFQPPKYPPSHLSIIFISATLLSLLRSSKEDEQPKETANYYFFGKGRGKSRAPIRSIYVRTTRG